MISINTDYQRLKEIEADLAIGLPYFKGKDSEIRNCWHFYTDGNVVDVIFQDDEDFRNGMNRIYVVIQKFDILVLAFCLMDNHVHFVLYGDLMKCSTFVHEYVRRTSMEINRKYGLLHKMKGVDINFQKIDTESYLKTAICYVIKNPYVAGLDFNVWDYPWSSAALYFRKRDKYEDESSRFIGRQNLCNDMKKKPSPGTRKLQIALKTHEPGINGVSIVNGLVNPYEYVSVNLVEEMFRSCRSFNYYLFKTKDTEVEARDGEISFLSIPDQELRQKRDEICKNEFAVNSVRSLDTCKRIILAKKLKLQFNCSTKQIARVCGLKFEEVTTKI